MLSMSKRGEQNKNSENLGIGTAVNVTSTIKSIMVDGTALAMKAAKDLDGLTDLRMTGIIAGVTSLGGTGYQALFTDHYDGKSIEKYTDLVMSGVSLLPHGWIASSTYFFIAKPLIFGDN